jgi:hypothetical protein
MTRSGKFELDDEAATRNFPPPHEWEEEEGEDDEEDEEEEECHHFHYEVSVSTFELLMQLWRDISICPDTYTVCYLKVWVYQTCSFVS